ncbi:MAG TPA: TMEM165/GDT1 family protein [Acidimicrobiales bacterium]|nr:TMEM165/GDT1 family protein [Acidimicrobiales bacterium]
MNPYVVLIAFPVVFLGELPDKTMFASLVMATRGKPGQVWLGAAGAFALHVAIATTVGAVIFSFLPVRVVEGIVAVLFLAGAGYALWLGGREKDSRTTGEPPRHGALVTAFVVIFLAEWGDLTQMLTANLAAHYRSTLAVAVGATLALWAVAALAVTGGQVLLRWVKVGTVRKVTAVVLIGLAAYSAGSALR